MPEVKYLTESPEGTYYELPCKDDGFQSSEVEMQEFLYGLVRYLKPNLVFESGSNHGFGTKALGMSVLANGMGRVVSCETDGDLYAIACDTCYTLPSVEIRHESSLNMPELREADFIFSDSDWESRAKEYELARPGALFVVHDTAAEPELGKFVVSRGGMNFARGRGFGLIVKK